LKFNAAEAYNCYITYDYSQMEVGSTPLVFC